MAVKFSQVLVFIIGGQSLFDYDIDLDESCEQGNKSKVQNITSRCHLQCHWYKNWAPKHTILQVHYYQTTRSKQLIQIFHNASHIISYENVLQVNNALAESSTLKFMNVYN